MTHQEIEKNVSRSERLSRVQSSDTGRRSLRIQKPDVSLVSLVAIIGVVAIIILFAFVIFLKTGNKNDDLSQKQPVAPIQNEVGENVTEEILINLLPIILAKKKKWKLLPVMMQLTFS